MNLIIVYFYHKISIIYYIIKFKLYNNFLTFFDKKFKIDFKFIFFNNLRKIYVYFKIKEKIYIISLNFKRNKSNFLLLLLCHRISRSKWVCAVVDLFTAKDKAFQFWLFDSTCSVVREKQRNTCIAHSCWKVVEMNKWSVCYWVFEMPESEDCEVNAAN